MNEKVYLNPRSGRKTLSSVNFNEDTIYEAHTLKGNTLVPYIKADKYENLVYLLQENKDKIEPDLFEEIDCL